MLFLNNMLFEKELKCAKVAILLFAAKYWNCSQDYLKQVEIFIRNPENSEMFQVYKTKNKTTIKQPSIH